VSDRAVLAAVIAVGVAARWAPPVPGALVVAACAVALCLRRPPFLVVLLVVIVGWRAHHELAALDDTALGPISGTAVLHRDPSRVGPGRVTVDATVGARRYLLSASPPAAGLLDDLSAGTEVRIAGRVSRFGEQRDWSQARHLAGVLTVDEVGAVRGRGRLWDVADRFRAPLLRGAEVLKGSTRAIYEGLVLGDDRGQRDLDRHRFRASGLSHLLVVSGENVAFVLVAVQPLLLRLGLRQRWLATIVILMVFGTAVRWEPSVVRAVAMAGVAATATWGGRRSAGIRSWSLAIGSLILIDPLIMRSAGFMLSAAATLGLVVMARPIADRLPGPRLVAEPVAVAIAAHLGVAPLLVVMFGVVPAAGLVVNLLAVPLAGWIMVWGLTAGLVAGLVAGSGLWWPAQVLHVPTTLMVSGVEQLAEWGSRPGLPMLGAVHVAALVGFGAVWWWTSTTAARRLRLVLGSMVTAGVLVIGLLAARPPGPMTERVDAGSWFRVEADGRTSVYVGGLASGEDLAGALSARRVKRIDLVVLTSSGPTASGVARLLAEVWPVAAVRPP